MVGSTSDQYSLPGPYSGDLYVVAHAVVCGVGTGTGGSNPPCDVDVLDFGGFQGFFGVTPGLLFGNIEFDTEDHPRSAAIGG